MSDTITRIKSIDKAHKIIIKKLDNKKQQYKAVYRHRFLKTTFSMVFTDTVFGAVSLSQFIQMIKDQFRLDAVRLYIKENTGSFKNDLLLSTVGRNKEKEVI